MYWLITSHVSKSRKARTLLHGWTHIYRGLEKKGKKKVEKDSRKRHCKNIRCRTKRV